MIVKNGEEYTTRNVALAGTLIVNAHDLLNIRFNKEGMPFFVFANAGNVHELSKQFYDGECRVEPKNFSIILRDLKRQVYEVKQQNGQAT